KASANTGPHVVSLWSSAGSRLAFTTFNGGSASGWQQVNFPAPVSVTANTVYVASYHCPAGHYSADQNYFATNGVDNPPLHALANGVSGGNGVFGYGPAGTFPSVTWNATHYWVDVAFNASSGGGDTLPPVVTSVVPKAGASGVALQSVIKVTFNEAMNASTINSSTVSLRNAENAIVSANISYNSTDRTVTLAPGAPLSVSSSYTVTVRGGASGVADSAGNRLAADFSWTFATATYGALAGGPGGPVLVITDESNPFSQYYAEILLAEGLNHFSLKDIHEVSATTLTDVEVVILGAIPLTTAQVTMLTQWVNGGGNLIAMRPDKKLASLLGLADAGTVLSEGYLQIDITSGPGVGIVGETIQYHGAADRYTLAGATRVARLYSNAQTATSNPAVTLRDVGSNGGQAAAFAFDLARSIVLMRQGNPAWAGQERDGKAPLRSSDLFYGAASFDPQPDWVNLDKVAIPQADEQQRLLANMILQMNADRNLLPRFWYFPSGHEAAVVMTGDDHSVNGTKGRFELEMGLSPEGGSVDDWETIRSTSYVFINNGALTNAQAVAYTAAGFEFSLHLTTNCQNFTFETLDALLAQQLAQWRAMYPSLSAPVTNRTHCIAWSGYTIAAEVEAKHGIRLDTNYYFWPEEWVLNRPGFMTGSAMPMRFATADGQVLDVYQAATQLTDESGQGYPFTADQLLDRALGPEKYYGAIVANLHTDEAVTSEWEATVLAAIDRGVPVISAKQLLTWTDGRNSSSIEDVETSSGGLSFQIKAGAGARGLK
ncbi:MAG: DUF4082 domain-containing protein, partial [Verrucomicrobiaceae bacterium]